MIHENFRVTGAHEAVLDYSDLFLITLDGDDFQDFDTRWDEGLLSNQSGTFRRRAGKVLKKMRIRESDQRRNVLAEYEQEIGQNLWQKLKTMVKRCMNQKDQSLKL